MKNKSKWRQQQKEFFADKLKELIKAKKKDDKSFTQGEFARRICELRESKTGESCPVTNSYVSEWVRAKWFPDEYLPEIAEVLGVEESAFFVQSSDDRWHLSSEYMSEVIGQGEMIPFCDEIGLDLRFLSVIRIMMGLEFDHNFPTWTALIKNPDLFDDREYIRMDKKTFAASAEMDDGTNILQYEMSYIENGETKTKLVPFSPADLRFLKEVQTSVIDYIDFLMAKRHKDMIREAEEATRQSMIDQGGGKFEIRPLSAEQLHQIDKYGDYSD